MRAISYDCRLRNARRRQQALHDKRDERRTGRSPHAHFHFRISNRWRERQSETEKKSGYTRERQANFGFF
jgi:hypothetical protein